MVWRGALEGQRGYRGLGSLLEELIVPGQRDSSTVRALQRESESTQQDRKSPLSPLRIGWLSQRESAVGSLIPRLEAGKGVGSECEQHQ